MYNSTQEEVFGYMPLPKEIKIRKLSAYPVKNGEQQSVPSQLHHAHLV
jgi:hypothetical protein